jgi:hypothetical protein
MKKNYYLILFTIILLNLGCHFGYAQPAMTWVKQYNGADNLSDKASAIAIDGSCNLYVTGQTDKIGAGTNYMTIKYDDEGNTIWATSYDGPSHLDDIPTAIKVDANGNVYVTGKSASSSNGFDFLTVKYNSSGVQQWASRLNSSINADDIANDLAVDANGNVYVCGDQGNGCALIKYNSSGNQTWVETFDEPGDFYYRFKKVIISNSGSVEVLAEAGNSSVYSPWAKPEVCHFSASNGNSSTSHWSGMPGLYNPVPVDFVLNSSGEAFVCVYSVDGTHENITILSTTDNTFAFATYTTTGTAISRPSKIKLDNSGNVYLCGYTDINTNAGVDLNYLTLKYNSSGVQQWKLLYGGNGEDKVIDMALGSGSAPDVYVTGYTTNTSGNKDITTIRSNNNGTLQSGWTQIYDGGTNTDDVPAGIKIDANNNILLSGYSGDLNTENYTTIKYCNNAFTPVITWTGLNTFTATAGTEYQWYFNDAPVSGANQQSFNISATGNGDYFCMVSQYCCTYKSNVATNSFVGIKEAFNDTKISVFPNPNQGAFTITYQLKPNNAGILEIFNSTGSCIYRAILPMGSSEQKVALADMATGIYNCVISSDNSRIVKKLAIYK